jgi:hypothetical protein
LSQLYDAVVLPALAMAEQDRHKGGLDPAREEFIFLSIREMLVEFSERSLKSDAVSADDVIAEERDPAVPAGRVFCVPANDEADEITAAMLTQLLEQAGRAAIAFPLDASLQHAVGLMAPAENDTFCISALPPFAFARARTLSRELQLRFPRTKVMIGVWGYEGDSARALQRFQPSRPAKLVTTLADAVSFVAAPDPAMAPGTGSLLPAALTKTPLSAKDSTVKTT